jgi:hypothetical protein
MDLPTNNQPAKPREIIRLPININERLALIANPSTTEAVLKRCLETDNETVLLAVLNSPNVTPGIIGILARKVNINVRRSVAECIKTPLEILLKLIDQFPIEVGSNPTYLNLIDESSESLENLLSFSPKSLTKVEISENLFSQLYDSLIKQVITKEETLEDWSELDENDEEIDDNYLKLAALINNPLFPQSLKDKITVEKNQIFNQQEGEDLEYSEEQLDDAKIDLLITIIGSDRSANLADFSKQLMSSDYLHILSESAMIGLVSNPNLPNELLSHIFSISENLGLIDVYISAVDNDSATKFLPVIIKIRNNFEKEIDPKSPDSEFLTKLKNSLKNIRADALNALRKKSK